jgi:hypothetical protein
MRFVYFIRLFRSDNLFIMFEYVLYGNEKDKLTFIKTNYILALKVLVLVEPWKL